MSTRTDDAGKEEFLVYCVDCPEYGLGYRVYNEEEIWASGGFHSVELEIERTTDRFARAGVIKATKTGKGAVFTCEDLAALPMPGDEQWQIGRLSPAYGRTDLEQQIYLSEVRAAQSLLDGWKPAQTRPRRSAAFLCAGRSTCMALLFIRG